jgi:hypothetical protein
MKDIKKINEEMYGNTRKSDRLKLQDKRKNLIEEVRIIKDEKSQ